MRYSNINDYSGYNLTMIQISKYRKNRSLKILKMTTQPSASVIRDKDAFRGRTDAFPTPRVAHIQNIMVEKLHPPTLSVHLDLQNQSKLVLPACFSKGSTAVDSKRYSKQHSNAKGSQDSVTRNKENRQLINSFRRDKVLRKVISSQNIQPSESSSLAPSKHRSGKEERMENIMHRKVLCRQINFESLKTKSGFGINKEQFQTTKNSLKQYLIGNLLKFDKIERIPKNFQELLGKAVLTEQDIENELGDTKKLGFTDPSLQISGLECSTINQDDTLDESFLSTQGDIVYKISSNDCFPPIRENKQLNLGKFSKRFPDNFFRR